jgi:hypothetical protein
MPLWSERRLIRLWHIMNEFRAVQFWWLSQELLRLERDLSDSVDKAWVLDLEARMTCAEDQCKTIALGEVAILPLYNIKTELHRFELTLNYPIEVESIKRELRAFRQNIEIELGKRRFAYIPQERARYFESEQPFGKEVYDAFPSIRFDLKEAGNSLACGMNTAAAFHFMRAAEVGLWELAKDRQIPLGDAIEFTDWGNIIRELGKAVEAIQQWKNSATKEDAHKFYNRLLIEIRAFNDGWRRHIAHVRKSQLPLEPDEVIALSGHVERFLRTMAPKISERIHTSLIWTT